VMLHEPTTEPTASWSERAVDSGGRTT
jgi:hypothetical protein